MWTRLDAIARNLWWSWNPDAAALFRYADPKLFHASTGNPIVVLRGLRAGRREQLEADLAFTTAVARVRGRLRDYLNEETWYDRTCRRARPGRIAYFCMEYALHESLPWYAGGLGVLAGDHLKSASDLGLPLVAIGIFWHKGYTRQRIDEDGNQHDRFPHLPVSDTPLRELRNRNRRPVTVQIQMGDDRVLAGAYRLEVGRIPLFLLDTDRPENLPRHRALVDVLYSGDRDMRIRQEMLLGIGGWQLLQTLRIPVAVYHLNEGHAAFASLERIREERNRGRTPFADALQAVRRTTVFTTHTPVPAGNEEFDPHLVSRYLWRYGRLIRIAHEDLEDLGRVKPGNKREPFGMTPLALRTAKYCNGVAALHGEVARRMWQRVYPREPVEKVPIGHVTNGIHLRTWLHPRMGTLLNEFLGEGWEDRQDDPARWAGIAEVPDGVLWKLHVALKHELVEACWRHPPHTARDPATPAAALDPDALTIGFARRFAPYKRAALIFTDPRRLARILNDRRRPVQIIFAGKAHPADADGKAIIRRIVRFSREPRFRGRVVFLEDYDMGIARHLVAGVDVWLNNPQRPREASGTSGMKPALHGGLNLSILDGWWPEACNGKNGWAIGRGKDHNDTPATDRRDADDLYRILERQVVPLYYDRDEDGLPHRWIARMKNAIATIPAFFNTHRQVKEYLTHYYVPAMRNAARAPQEVSNAAP
ncbi:MAG: alpha-glucan family phosphorylase [Planctomycetes bacterium]|nr:alpha-glucan family phosphorylase [Planctomycetota bacterium]